MIFKVKRSDLLYEILDLKDEVDAINKQRLAAEATASKHADEIAKHEKTIENQKENLAHCDEQILVRDERDTRVKAAHANVVNRLFIILWLLIFLFAIITAWTIVIKVWTLFGLVVVGLVLCMAGLFAMDT